MLGVMYWNSMFNFAILIGVSPVEVYIYIGSYGKRTEGRKESQ